MINVALWASDGFVGIVAVWRLERYCGPSMIAGSIHRAKFITPADDGDGVVIAMAMVAMAAVRPVEGVDSLHPRAGFDQATPSW
jgi:hypothetical protein